MLKDPEIAPVAPPPGTRDPSWRTLFVLLGGQGPDESGAP